MERLGFVDQVMHKVGTSGMPPLHMQGAMVIDPATSQYEINAMILAEHIASRLIGFDILRKKLVQDPLKIGDVRMVEDPDFDVWDHISFARLPSPGDKRCLEIQLGKFSARDFDHNHPLWQFEIIEGLEGGKICIAQKLSHATMDGTAAMKVMMSIFDQEPSPPNKLESKKPLKKVKGQPSKLDLLGSALKENVQRYGKQTPKILGTVTKNIASVAMDSINSWLASDAGESQKVEKPKGPTCYPNSLNKAISANKRVVAVGIYKTDELKGISKALGCKLNDLCLAMVSEAIACYFKGIGEALKGDYVFVMPMSTRSADDKSHGNALALSPISSHSSIKSLPKRLAAIQRDTLEAKAKAGKVESKTKKPSVLDDVGNITDIVSPLVIDIAAGLLAKLNPWDKINFPANGVMSNVAGPREAMFFAGMPIEYQIPMIPIFHKAGLSVGATSMGNHFSFGFHGCGKAIKQEDMHFLLDGLQKAFDELAKAAQEAMAAHANAPAVEAAPVDENLAVVETAVVETVVVEKAVVENKVAKQKTAAEKPAATKKPRAKKAPLAEGAEKPAPTSKRAPARKT